MELTRRTIGSAEVFVTNDPPRDSARASGLSRVFRTCEDVFVERTKLLEVEVLFVNAYVAGVT